MKRPNRFVVLLGAGLLAAASGVIVGAADDWQAPARAARKKNPVPSDEKSLAAGKDVYAHQCRSCHGDHGKGDGPGSKDLNPKPRDLGAQNVADQTDGALFWKITEGKKPMPSFDKMMTEEQRWQTVNYIRTFAKKS